MVRLVEKNIYFRGENQFQVKLMASGRTISETFETLSDARIYRDKLRSDTALDPDKRATLVQRARKREAASETLAKLLDRYVDEVSTQKKSEETDRARVRKIKRHPIANISVYGLGKDDIQEFFDSLARGEERDGKIGRGASGSSIRRYASLLSHALKTARRRWGMPVSNPLADMELPQNGRPRKRRFTEDEESALLEQLAKARNEYALPAVLFSVETALRRGELLQLRWRDVDLKKRTAFVNDSKNSESRVIPLTSEALKILKKLPGYENRTTNKESLLFPVASHNLREAWEAACLRANIHGLRWHDLRREGSSRLFEKHGLDVIEVASVTGHKTLQVLKDHYVNLNAQKIAAKLR